MLVSYIVAAEFYLVHFIIALRKVVEVTGIPNYLEFQMIMELLCSLVYSVDAFEHTSNATVHC